MSGFVAMLTMHGPGRDEAAVGRVSSSDASVAGPVLVLAGGTGGHIFPGIAVANELRERGVPVLWVGSDGGLETELVPKAGIALRTLAVRGVRGKGFATRLAAPWRIMKAVASAWRLIGTAHPRCALALGGFAAGPAGIAAWLRRVPLLVHEQNRVAGVTNRILARFAKKTLCGFAHTLAGGEWLGNPVRSSIAAIAAPELRCANRDGALRLLVLGGSQGARSLNETLPRVLRELPLPLDVRHQCGARHIDATRAAYAGSGVAARVDAFVDDMAAAYAWADLVVCRAGALTLAELCAAGVAAVLVPFPAAVDDHQTRNGEALVAAGAARLAPEGADFAARLQALLAELCAGEAAVARARLLAMAQAARGLAKPDAAARIADRCLEAAR